MRPATLVRVCDECNYGSYAGRCVICGGIGISDAYYCKECTMQEKDVRARQRCVQGRAREPALTPHVFRPSPANAERRVSKDCQPRQRENRSVLRAEKMCAPGSRRWLHCVAWCFVLRCRQRLTRSRPLRLADGFKKR